MPLLEAWLKLQRKEESSLIQNQEGELAWKEATHIVVWNLVEFSMETTNGWISAQHTESGSHWGFGSVTLRLEKPFYGRSVPQKVSCLRCLLAYQEHERFGKRWRADYTLQFGRNQALPG